MIKPVRYILLLSACLLLIGCSGKNDEELWGIYQEPIEPKPYPDDTGAQEIALLWSQDVGRGDSSGYALFRPDYSDGYLYTADRGGQVYKLNAENGGVIWSTDLDDSLFSGVAVGDGVAVVTMDNGEVVALSDETGEVLWKSNVKRQFSSIPVVGNTRVVVRTADGLILGLNSRSGQSVWRLEKPMPGLTVHGDSTPTIVGDAVLFGLATGSLVAANVINGQEYWEAEIAYIRGTNEIERLIDSDTPAIVRGNFVFTAAYGNHIVALRIEGAETVWKSPVSTRLPMVIAADKLFATNQFGAVVALDVKTGAGLWKQEAFQGRGVSHPVVVGDRVVIGDAEGRLHSLNVDTGALVQSRKAASGAITSLSVGKENQFTAFSSEGKVATFSLQ